MSGEQSAQSSENTERKDAHNLSGFIRNYMSFPVPGDLNLLWTLGAVLLVVLALMIASGLLLATSYTPDVSLAFSSVEALERRGAAGWLLRAIHTTGASFFMAALYIHMFRGLCYRSYAAPRRAIWHSGVTLLLMAMMTAFAGYVLPWGQMSYWGADIAGKAAGAVPGVGPLLESIFLGGDSPGSPTLRRMFVLHFTIAFSIAGLVALHIAIVHFKGSSSPSGSKGQGRERMLSFHPYFTVKDVLSILVCALAFVAVMCFWPGLVTEPENYRPANPLHTPASIEPEWYFLPFYGMLQAIPSKFGGLVLSAGAVLILFFVPSLDDAPVDGRPWGRMHVQSRIALCMLIACFVVSGLAGKHHVQGDWLLVERIAMAGYYGYFLIFLPLAARSQKADLPDEVED
ncbi:cytochrome b [Acetobacter thailandicus]|uniref:cytochrome b n=1 Tax=Acetobacter thailandicus TaxID=1502842 RepID=UPI001BA7AC11|nr:cytochrome b N-terminal domain-containing protein [Acetobacter thailandicus]MBS0979316.1 cytochrome b N-terminal domain-containing protein [Acetobacter thailandicus]